MLILGALCVTGLIPVTSMVLTGVVSVGTNLGLVMSFGASILAVTELTAHFRRRASETPAAGLTRRARSKSIERRAETFDLRTERGR